MTTSIDSHLSSSIAKLNRAKKHLDELQASIARYKSSNPYTIRIEEHSERNEAELKLSVNVYPPLEEWVLIIGDASHNLRSALDHLACTLVRLETPSANTSKTAFPIYSTLQKFTDDFNRKVIGMHPDSIAFIQRLKPYGGGNDWFYRLSEVDNTDKHRLLITTFTAPQSIQFSIEAPSDNRTRNQLRIFPNMRIDIKDGATVAVVRDMVGKLSKMEVDRNPSLDIVFDQPSIVTNIKVSEFLGNSVSLVEDVINQTDTLIGRLYPHASTPIP